MTDDFSTSFYARRNRHHPLKIDIKLSQKIFKHYEIYLMCRNILDDYHADPSIRAPAEMWYAGIKASF